MNETRNTDEANSEAKDQESFINKQSSYDSSGSGNTLASFLQDSGDSGNQDTEHPQKQEELNQWPDLNQEPPENPQEPKTLEGDPDTGNDNESEEGGQQSGSENWEGRYKELQSHSTRVSQELAELRKQNEQFNRLLHPLQHRLKFDENGNPIGWNTSEPEPIKPPERPSQDDWLDDPDKAREMEDAYQDWRMEQKLKERESASQQRQEEEQRKQSFIEIKQNSVNQASELFPDLKDENSELRQKCEEFFRSHPHLLQDPLAPLTVAKSIAFDLGISAQKATTPPQKPGTRETTPQVKKGSVFLTQHPESNAGKASASPVDDEYNAYMAKQKQFQT